MGIPVCRVEDSFDLKKLRNDGSSGVLDPCLENNIFLPIPLEDVRPVIKDGGPVVEIFNDLSHVTWYANGFENKPTKSGIIFKAYDFTAALTNDLTNKFPPGSLVKVTYQGKSVVVMITDRKPPDEKAHPELRNHSVDLSKAAAFELGGYDLLQHGVVSPVTLELVELNCESRYDDTGKIDHRAHCLPQNNFLSIKTALFKISPFGNGTPNPDPAEYGAIIKFYHELTPIVNGFSDYLSLFYYVGGEIKPRLELRLVQQYEPTAENSKRPTKPHTYFYWDVRITGIPNEEDMEIWKAMLSERYPKLDMVEGREEWPSYTQKGTVPAVVVKRPYHKKDPAVMEPINPSAKPPKKAKPANHTKPAKKKISR